MFTAVLVLGLAYDSSLAATLRQIPGNSYDAGPNTNGAASLLDGDIIPSRQFLKQSNNRSKRSSIYSVFQNYKWPGGVIPYTLSSTYRYHEKMVILNAMFHIEESTCIRFVKRRRQDDYLRISPIARDDCSSYVGRQGGRQDLSLGQNCLYGDRKQRYVQHELMHAIGFIHEHKRPDRDHYVWINWNNISPEVGTEASKKCLNFGSIT